ncbi:MAG: hypothetical protein H5U04_05415 [Firmicutes bacterium]|nr:hypothetical protein [Bacillota bacterium]
MSAAMTLAQFQELRMRLYARARRGGPLGQLPAKAAERDLIEEWFSPDSVEKLQESLRKGLPTAVYDALVEWARASSQQQIASWQGRIRPRLEKVAWAKQADNSPRQGNSAALRAAYQLMNPKDWLDSFKATFEVSDIRLGYNRFLRSANSSLPFLDLPNRYQLPEASFKALEAGVLLGLTQVYEALGQLAMRLSSQVKLLKEVKEALGFNIGFKLVAKLVGGAIAGPLGSLAAGLFFNPLAEDRQRVREGHNQVLAAWELFLNRLDSCWPALEARYRHALMCLYGGLMLRLVQDLRSAGIDLIGVDLGTGQITTTVAENDIDRVISWAHNWSTKLDDLISANAWSEAEMVSREVAKAVLAQPHVGRVVYRDRSLLCWSVIYRTVLVFHHAQDLWSNGRKREAAGLYWKWFEESPVCPDDQALLQRKVLPVHAAASRLINQLLRNSDWISEGKQGVSLSEAPFFKFLGRRVQARQSPFPWQGEVIAPALVRLLVSYASFARVKPGVLNTLNKREKRASYVSVARLYRRAARPRWSEDPFYRWLVWRFLRATLLWVGSAVALGSVAWLIATVAIK